MLDALVVSSVRYSGLRTRAVFCLLVLVHQPDKGSEDENMSTTSIEIKSSTMNGLVFFDNTAGKKVADKAIAKFVDAQADLTKVAAAGFYNLFAHGNNTLINYVYRELAKRDETAHAANSLRVHLSNSIMDRFGRGGKTNLNTERLYNDKGERIADKWVERPANFFRFRNEVGEEKLPGFEIVATRKKDGTLPENLSQATVDAMRAAKKAIGEKGPDCLILPWKTAENEREDAKVFGLPQLQTSMIALLKKAAKAAHANGVTNNDIDAIGKMFEIAPEKIGEIKEAMVSKKPSKSDVALPMYETAADLIKTIDHKADETKSEIPPEVPTGTEAHVH